MGSKWEKIESLLISTTDRLGMPIDPGILDLVICLRMLELNTIASCFGHEKRITGGPYVMIAAEDAIIVEKQYRMIDDKINPEYKPLREQARKINLIERAKLTPYLQSFYADRTTDFDDRIIIASFGAYGTRLNCQGAENARILDVREKQELLTRHQREFKDFTQHLIERIKVKPTIR